MNNCKYFKLCGACKYPLDDYETALKSKVKEYQKILKDFRIGEVVANPCIYHYRNKITYRFFMQKAKLCAGFYEEGKAKPISIDDCLIQKETASKIMKDILNYLNRYHVEAYNPLTKMGLVRYVMFRISSDDKVSMCLVLGSREFKGSNNFFKTLRKLHPEIVNIDMSINSRNTTVVIEGNIINVYGLGYLKDKMGDFIFNIPNNAFYQVNHDCALKIYEDVVKRLGIQKDDVILDAYCGIGTISLFLAAKAKEVIGVEINAQAVKMAKINARDNNIDNVSFITSDVSEYIYDNDFDILVVDPTRSGMDDRFINTALKKRPKKIAYVSCNPLTMADDLKKLKNDYSIEDISLYDQFGFTSHFEALTILHRK